MSGPASAEDFRHAIVSEVCYALGASRRGLTHRILEPLLRVPVGRFARIAAIADQAADRSGLSGAARRILPELSMQLSVRGAEKISAVGPLLVTANHAGGFDSVALLACLPRSDVKVVLSDAPLFRAFAAARRWFIFAPLNASGGARAVRSCIAHLRAGGAVLIFANGDVERDPEISPNAGRSFAGWSRGVEVMLRNVPETRLQAAIISGVLLPRYLRHPLVRLRREETRRQKLGEALQILRHMTSPRAVPIRPHISFAEPIPATDLDEGHGLMPGVIAAARRLLAVHLARLEEGWPEGS